MILSVPGASQLNRLRHRGVALVKPRLGNLHQYRPRRMPDPQVSTPIGIRERRVTISLVTPSLNQGQYVGRTLASVLDQNYPGLEYRVQDGGSSDQTVEVLESWSHRLAGWVSEPDRGQSDALNRAFAGTSGEIMAWLNSDDMLLPGTLERVEDFFLRHPEIDVVYGHRLLIDEDDMEVGRWLLPRHQDKVLSWVDYIPQETLFWRRRIWEKSGSKIDESFQFAMDWDLLVRFRDAGARFARIDFFLGAFRIHPLQKTTAAIAEVGHGEMDSIRERCLGYIPRRSEIRRAVTPYLVRHLVKHMLHRINNR